MGICGRVGKESVTWCEVSVRSSPQGWTRVSAMGLVGGQQFTRILSMHPAKTVILAEMGALDQQKVFRVIEVLFEDTVEIP